MWFSLAKLALHAGKEVYKNRQESKILHSLAERKHLEKVIAGEVEYKKEILRIWRKYKGEGKRGFK